MIVDFAYICLLQMVIFHSKGLVYQRVPVAREIVPPEVLSHAGVVLNYSTMVTAHDERAVWQKEWVDGVANDILW